MSEQTLKDDSPTDTGAADESPPGPPASAADESLPGPPAGAADQLRREKDALYDRLLRTAAEFDNYRKRVERERRDLADWATGNVLVEMLPIVDNFERALQAPGTDVESFRAGFELIHRQLLDLLKRRGVSPIEAAGAMFDPNVHEAVVHEVSPDHREGEVIEELQRGYRQGDRLLRPAMVKVAKQP
jgi:molecular chaperone GrpE